MVTIRPDADALGTMAVLNLRARRVALTRAARARVELIAECDAFAKGPWRDWIAARGPLTRPAAAAEVCLFPAAYAEATALATDAAMSLAERVAGFEAWLLDGGVPQTRVRAARRSISDLAGAYNSGRVRLEARDGVAWVRGHQPGAAGLGYRLAPVVIALTGGATPRKVVIAQFAPGHVDLGAVLARLNALEPGWGGSPTIIGSPQGVGSDLSEATIGAAVDAAMPGPACAAMLNHG
jgi:hypothetical protein